MDRDGVCQATMNDLILEKPIWQASIKRTRPWNPCVDLPRQHESGYELVGRSCQKALQAKHLTPQLDGRFGSKQ
jgi:hypothetical protein